MTGNAVPGEGEVNRAKTEIPSLGLEKCSVDKGTETSHMLEGENQLPHIFWQTTLLKDSMSFRI